LAQAFFGSVVKRKFFGGEPGGDQFVQARLKQGRLAGIQLGDVAASKSSPMTEKCLAQHAAVTLPRCQRQGRYVHLRVS